MVSTVDCFSVFGRQKSYLILREYERKKPMNQGSKRKVQMLYKFYTDAVCCGSELITFYRKILSATVSVERMSIEEVAIVTINCIDSRIKLNTNRPYGKFVAGVQIVQIFKPHQTIFKQ